MKVNKLVTDFLENEEIKVTVEVYEHVAQKYKEGDLAVVKNDKGDIIGKGRVERVGMAIEGFGEKRDTCNFVVVKDVLTKDQMFYALHEGMEIEFFPLNKKK